MLKILKYRVPIAEKFVTDLPAGARIVRVEDVEGEFFLWAMVDPDPDVERAWFFFECYKTGQPILTHEREVDPDRLVQCGRLRLYVMQELMLYVFLRSDLSGMMTLADDVHTEFQRFKQSR